MSVEVPATDSPRFKDRSIGLIVFGAIQILMGALCAMFIPLVLLPVVLDLPAGAPTNVQTMIPALGLYAILAVALVWLGIGSILARRWARALTLVLAWTWLVMGIVASIAISVLMPNLSAAAAQDPQVPPEALIFMKVVMLGTIGCIYLVIPGVFVVFYQSPHVKATCEFKDPHVRWTDKCPLPVLALSLMLGFGAVSMLPSLSYRALPFFGVVLKGVPAALVIVGVALLFAYLAWATYKLKMSAWWTTLAVYGGFGVSTIVTFSRISMMDFYREMDMPEEQLAIIQNSRMLDGMAMPVMMGAGFVLIMGFMIWVRGYFVRAAAPVDS